jgi:hypothetical protein
LIGLLASLQSTRVLAHGKIVQELVGV